MESLNLSPRNFWLRKRVVDCIFALSELQVINNWDDYIKTSKILAEELLYVTTEWDKYYEDKT